MRATWFMCRFGYLSPIYGDLGQQSRSFHSKRNSSDNLRRQQRQRGSNGSLSAFGGCEPKLKASKRQRAVSTQRHYLAWPGSSCCCLLSCWPEIYAAMSRSPRLSGQIFQYISPPSRPKTINYRVCVCCYCFYRPVFFLICAFWPREMAGSFLSHSSLGSKMMKGFVVRFLCQVPLANICLAQKHLA